MHALHSTVKPKKDGCKSPSDHCTAPCTIGESCPRADRQRLPPPKGPARPRRNVHAEQATGYGLGCTGVDWMRMQCCAVLRCVSNFGGPTLDTLRRSRWTLNGMNE